MIKLSSIKPNPNNPRLIKDDKFKKLVKSISEFPKMMSLRPIVVDEDNIILGGNMRYKALQELGKKEIPKEWIKKASELTEEEKKEFIIKDNVGFGEWDEEMLHIDWDVEQLDEWGLELPVKTELNEVDLFDINLPFYEPSEICPNENELANIEKTKDLIDKIKNLEISEYMKELLIIRASFFTDFDFQKIADFYSKQNKEVKEIFEQLGMVILAPKEALKHGFIELTERLFEL